MPNDPITSDKTMRRIEVQSAEFDALKKLIVQDRRLSMTPIVDDDYPAVREEWELAMHHFLQAAVNNRPEQVRMIVGRTIDPAESKLALELVRMGVAPVSFQETTCEAALRALKNKPDNYLSARYDKP